MTLLSLIFFQVFRKRVIFYDAEISSRFPFDEDPDLETVILPRSVLHLLPDPPDNAAVFLYAGTREDWDKITFYTDESKAKWEARTIFENQS